MRPRAFAWIALACAVPQVAHAAPGSANEAAKKRAYAGVEAYQAGKYDVASAELEPAFAVVRAPSVGLWSARALMKLGRWVEAVERYRVIGELDPGAGDKRAVQDKARVDAAKELAELLARTPVVRVKLENAAPEEVTVTLDGVALDAPALSSDRLVNPGEHAILGLKKSERVRASVTASESGRYVVPLKFAAGSVAAEGPAPGKAEPGAGGDAAAGSQSGTSKSNGSALRTAGFVGLGIGGAGLLLSGISALVAVGKKPDGCDGNKCPPGTESAVDAYGTWRTVSTISFWSGAALASVGAVLVFTAPSGESGAGVALNVTPTHAEIRGSF